MPRRDTQDNFLDPSVVQEVAERVDVVTRRVDQGYARAQRVVAAI